MIIIKTAIKKFRVFTLVYWVMILGVSGMYTMYITQMGFSKQEVSIAVTIYTLSGLIGQTFVGYLVDKFNQIKKVMLIFISMGLIVAIGLAFAKLNWQIYLLLSIWGFFITGTIPLSEAWCIGTLKQFNEQRNFGKVRGFGSIGYGLAGPFLGLLLQSFGWKVYPWYIIISILILLLAIYTMSDKYGINKSEQQESLQKVDQDISLKEALREILKIRPLIGMISIIFMYTFVVRGIYIYLGLLVSDYGGGVLSLGFTYFFDATPEVVTFFLAARLLKKFHSKNLIFVAFLLQIVRLSVILIFNNALAVILMGILSGFAYGLVAASYKTYIYELAPAKYKASCMSISESIIGSSGIISAPVFGFLFTKFGTNFAILFGLIVYIIIVLVLLKDIVVNNKSRIKVDGREA